MIENNSTNMEGAGNLNGTHIPLPRHREHKIMEKNCHVQFTKQLEAAYFATPTNSIEEFVSLFEKVAQHGVKHQFLLLFSRPWVKHWVPKLLEDRGCHNMLLQPNLVTNEDFIRLLICNVPQDKLSMLGKIRNDEEDTLLHVVCKGVPVDAYTTSASLADILSFLITICPSETFCLEAQDLRGQTPLHLAAQSGDTGLVQVLLDCGADPNV